MAKTMEQLNTEFTTLMANNGFTLNGEKMYDGREVYSRTFTKETEVVWYGMMESSLEVKAAISYDIPDIRIFKNGQLDSRRDYSSPKRMMNALREIVRIAGYEFQTGGN